MNAHRTNNIFAGDPLWGPMKCLEATHVPERDPPCICLTLWRPRGAALSKMLFRRVDYQVETILSESWMYRRVGLVATTRHGRVEGEDRIKSAIGLRFGGLLMYGTVRRLYDHFANIEQGTT